MRFRTSSFETHNRFPLQNNNFIVLNSDEFRELYWLYNKNSINKNRMILRKMSIN